MEPHIGEGENLLVEKRIFSKEKFKRGDIVIFHFPLNRKKIFVKRVIGLPGETVEIKRGVVFIDGKKLNEPYLKGDISDKSNMSTVNIPEGAYFVLGDNRSVSNDSRNWGVLPDKFIIGKVLFSYWPPSKIGEVK